MKSPIRIHRSCLVFSVPLLVFAALSATADPPHPVVLAPGYEHDRWVTLPADTVREFRAYTTSFDGLDDDDGDGSEDLWRVPQWVAYEIRKFDGTLPTFSRPPWFTDDELHDDEVAPADESYRGSGFDRGHLCMKNIATRLGEAADANTHSMLNAVPQKPNLNQGIWLDLEKKTQEWADAFDKIWVICGPVFFGKRPTSWIGDEGELRVAVPDGFFKIVVKAPETGNMDRPDVLAFFYPHHHPYSWDEDDYDHTKFLVPVNYLESLTGLDFLSDLPSSTEGSVEAGSKQKLWE